jgi:hypothetical protein
MAELMMSQPRLGMLGFFVNRARIGVWALSSKESGNIALDKAGEIWQDCIRRR